MSTPVFISIIHNTQDGKATQAPKNRPVNEKAVVPIHNGILLGHIMKYNLEEAKVDSKGGSDNFLGKKLDLVTVVQMDINEKLKQIQEIQLAEVGYELDIRNETDMSVKNYSQFPSGLSSEINDEVFGVMGTFEEGQARENTSGFRRVMDER